MSGASSGMRGMILRPMTGSDIDCVMEIAAQSATAPQWHREAYTDALAHSAAAPRLAHVAELEGHVIGFVMANIVTGEAEIESVAVAAEYRRRGVAAHLLHRLIADLRAACASRIMLEVRESNIVAQRLYTHMGFRQTGRRRGYYHSPVEDAFVFEMHLRSDEQ